MQQAEPIRAFSSAVNGDGAWSRTLRRCGSIRDPRNRHTIMRDFLPSWCRAATTGSTNTLEPTIEEEPKEQCSAAADDHHRGRPSMRDSHRLLMRFAISSTSFNCSITWRCPVRNSGSSLARHRAVLLAVGSRQVARGLPCDKRQRKK